LKVKRNTVGEIEEDKYKIDHGILQREIQLPSMENYQNPDNIDV